MEAESEEWRPVVGFEGWYEVSSLGRVRRVRAASGAIVNRILAQRLSKGTKQGAYPRVALYTGQKDSRLDFRVHRLVAAAFLGPAPRGSEVNHKDCNPQNNHVANLEYVTHTENMRHAWDNGRIRNLPKRTSNLTEQHIIAIRALAPLFRYSKIAELFGISEDYVAIIVNRHAWKHVA